MFRAFARMEYLHVVRCDRTHIHTISKLEQGLQRPMFGIAVGPVVLCLDQKGVFVFCQRLEACQQP